MDANPPKPRSWFRFSLRTMFIAVTLVAALGSWLASEYLTTRKREHLLERMNKCVVTSDPYIPGLKEAQLAHTGWIRWTLGGEDYKKFTVSTGMLSSDKEELQRLFPEASIVVIPSNGID
jgi:hypothetical protein